MHNVRALDEVVAASPLGRHRGCSTSNLASVGSTATTTCRCSGKRSKPNSA